MISSVRFFASTDSKDGIRAGIHRAGDARRPEVSPDIPNRNTFGLKGSIFRSSSHCTLGRRYRYFHGNGLRRCSPVAWTVEIHSKRQHSAQHRGRRLSNDLLIFDAVLTTIPLKWICGVHCRRPGEKSTCLAGLQQANSRSHECNGLNSR
jgi:hypothetical protein